MEEKNLWKHKTFKTHLFSDSKSAIILLQTRETFEYTFSLVLLLFLPGFLHALRFLYLTKANSNLGDEKIEIKKLCHMMFCRLLTQKFCGNFSFLHFAASQGYDCGRICKLKQICALFKSHFLVRADSKSGRIRCCPGYVALELGSEVWKFLKFNQILKVALKVGGTFVYSTEKYLMKKLKFYGTFNATFQKAFTWAF